MRGALVDPLCVTPCGSNTSDIVDALILDLPSLPTMLLSTLSATACHILLYISNNTSDIVNTPTLNLPEVSSNVDLEIILWAQTSRAVFKKF